MKNVIYGLILVVLLGCGGPKIVYDYDAQKNFTKYKTYNYYPELNTDLSDFDLKRLLEATDNVLVKKGLTKSENPQLYINFKSKEYSTPSNNTLGVGIGTGPLQVGGNVPFGAPNQRIQLTIDFIDVETDELIWQAEADDTQNSKQTPESRTGFFNIMMQKVLDKYPPQKK